MTVIDAARIFSQGDDFIFTTHEAPDADGLGAQFSLTAALRGMGKRARAVNADKAPARYEFLDPRGIIENLDDSGLEECDLSRTTVVLVDTNDIQYTGAMADIALTRAERVMVFDHHETKGMAKDEACALPTASSTCEMAYFLLRELAAPIGPDIAAALFAGIVYDTGSFGYAKTSESTFEAALDLVRLGAAPSLIHNQLYESSSTSVLLLRKAVLSTLELHADGRIALQTMTREMLDETKSCYEDSEDLINVPLQSKNVQVSIFFKSNSAGVLRCSLRSKGAINVAHIAQTFGGGGHKTAAGFKSPYPLETMRKKVLEIVTSTLPD